MPAVARRISIAGLRPSGSLGTVQRSNPLRRISTLVHRRPQLHAGARPPASLVPRFPHASPTIRLALLSDSVLLRSGLRSILALERSFEVVAEAASPPVHAFVRTSSPHIILVDAHVKDALSVSSELRESRVRPRVILVEADCDEAWAVHALKTGIRGILTKSATVENLYKAIRVVHQGELWASSRVVALSIEELASHSVPSSLGQSAIETRLSDREQEIVHAIVTGLSNQEAATQLGITEATVKAHLTRIFRKLSVHTRAQLAALSHRSAPTLPKYTSTPSTPSAPRALDWLVPGSDNPTRTTTATSASVPGVGAVRPPP